MNLILARTFLYFTVNNRHIVATFKTLDWGSRFHLQYNDPRSYGIWNQEGSAFDDHQSCQTRIGKYTRGGGDR